MVGRTRRPRRDRPRNLSIKLSKILEPPDSHGVSSPSAHWSEEATCTRLTAWLCYALRFSQPLSVLFLHLTVPALFHAGSAHGVWDPTERSPAGNRFASSAHQPVLSKPPQGSVTPVSSRAATALARLHGFTPPSSPFMRGRYFTADAAAALWASSPSRCSSFSPQRTPSRSLPLAYLRKNLSRRKASHLVP